MLSQKIKVILSGLIIVTLVGGTNKSVVKAFEGDSNDEINYAEAKNVETFVYKGCKYSIIDNSKKEVELIEYNIDSTLNSK